MYYTTKETIPTIFVEILKEQEVLLDTLNNIYENEDYAKLFTEKNHEHLKWLIEKLTSTLNEVESKMKLGRNKGYTTKKNFLKHLKFVYETIDGFSRNMSLFIFYEEMSAATNENVLTQTNVYILAMKNMCRVYNPVIETLQIQCG